MIDVYVIPMLTDNYSFVLRDHKAKKTAVVDPAETSPVSHFLAQKKWSLDFILNTHHHWDHIDGNQGLKQQYNCQVAASTYDTNRIPEVDISLNDGDSISLGSTAIHVIFTPGHTLGHICYFIPQQNILFSGDTLFAMGCGRLFEGSPQQMLSSLQRLAALPGDTQIYCAHEYTDVNGQFAQKIEPNNQQIIHRNKLIKQQTQAQQMTIPFNLQTELSTNPFLRTANDQLKKQLGLATESDLSVFTHLRNLRNEF